MKLLIRQGSVPELVRVNQQITEFAAPYTEAVFRQRLEGRRWYGLVAESVNALVGFKVGYEESETVFYSWLGGVLAERRGQGIARELLYEQERWVRRQGYRQIRVKSRNRFRSMLTLLTKEGYERVAVEPQADPADTRIHFLKTL